MAPVAFAQTESTTMSETSPAHENIVPVENNPLGISSTSMMITAPDEIGIPTKGVRFSLVKSFLDLKNSSKVSGVKVSNKEDSDQAIGIGVGYVLLPLQQLGFTSRLLYNLYDTQQADDPASFRLELSAAYAVTDVVYGFAGLNTQKFVTGRLDGFKPGAGVQAGVGAQFNATVGADLAYLILNNDRSIDGGSAEIQMSGLELSLNATF